MSNFLKDRQIFSKIKDVCKTSGGLKYLAVSYWGEGATDALDLDSRNQIRVVLDIEAGGTNPRELKVLRDRLGKENVKVLNNLHTKIYASKESAVVGSANASRNGLSFSGNGNIEAAVYVVGKEAKKAYEFAKDQFFSGEETTDDHIDICRRRFRRRTTAFAEEGELQKIPLSDAILRKPEILGNLPLLCSYETIPDKVLSIEWKKQSPNISPSESEKDYESVKSFWDGYNWRVDKNYVDRVCLGIHRGPRGSLNASVFRVSEPSEDFTFVRYLPWTCISNLKHRSATTVRVRIDDPIIRSRFEDRLMRFSEEYSKYRETWALIGDLV